MCVCVCVRSWLTITYITLHVPLFLSLLAEMTDEEQPLLQENKTSINSEQPQKVEENKTSINSEQPQKLEHENKAPPVTCCFFSTRWIPWLLASPFFI